jgi:hypothetical protein
VYTALDTLNFLFAILKISIGIIINKEKRNKLFKATVFASIHMLEYTKYIFPFEIIFMKPSQTFQNSSKKDKEIYKTKYIFIKCIHKIAVWFHTVS